MRDLIDFAAGDAEGPTGSGGSARLPIAMQKLERMLATLLDAQFVSFTE
jgi:hypothetical protein